jgi:hypothetical protein
MRKLLRFLGGVLGVMLLFVALSPWLLYELGLSRFDGMPDRPAQIATAEQQAWVWAQARGTGQPKVEPMNPYGYVLRFFSGNGRMTPSESLISWAGDDYTRQQLPQIRAWWHLSKVSMAIWMSRHWTTEETASAAYAVAIKWPPRKPRPVSPEP